MDELSDSRDSDLLDAEEVTRTQDLGLVDERQVLFNSLDALVRSVRTNPAVIPNLVDRTLKHWLALKDNVVELEPGGLKNSEGAVFSANEEEGLWILPAFMAGLRRFKPFPDAYPENLEGLVYELAELAPEEECINRFRDWLWADGAEGFDVTLDMSFAEGIETAFDDLDIRKKKLAAMRVETIQSLCENAVEVPSQTLDIAAAREEFQVPLDEFGKQLADDTLRATPADIEELREVTEDGYFWMNAQVILALSSPEIQGALHPERLVRLLTQSMRDRIDLRLIDLIAKLGKRQDPYAQKLIDAFKDQPLGELIGASIRFDRAGVKALAALIVSGPPTIVKGITSVLLERSVDDRDAFNALKVIAPSVVFKRLFDATPIDKLTPKAARSLGTVTLRAKDPGAHLPVFLDQVSPTVAISVLSQASQEQLWQQRDRVSRLLKGETSEAERRALVRILLATNDARWKPIIGGALIATSGEGWCNATLRVVCQEMIADQLEETTLIPLVQNLKSSEQAVIAALRALENTPEALRRVSRFKLRELIVAPEIRQRLKRVRKKLKEIDRG